MPNGPAEITVKEWAEVREILAVLRDRSHAQANTQQQQVARDYLAGKTATASAGDVPLWIKIGGAAVAMILGLVTLVSLYSATVRQDAVVVARLAAVEAWKIEQTTANLPSKVQNLETGFETARRIRDQQQQGVADRMRALELADQAGAERINTVLQQLATITAQLQAQASRVEELLRRQDRLENRLGARPGSAPPQEQPTSLTLPLTWRDPVLGY